MVTDQGRLDKRIGKSQKARLIIQAYREFAKIHRPGDSEALAEHHDRLEGVEQTADEMRYDEVRNILKETYLAIKEINIG